MGSKLRKPHLLRITFNVNFILQLHIYVDVRTNDRTIWFCTKLNVYTDYRIECKKKKQTNSTMDLLHVIDLNAFDRVSTHI